MNHNPQPTPENLRLALELNALRHVFNLPADERLEAADKLAACALELPLLLGTVGRELEGAPGMGPDDVARMLDRPQMKDEAARIDVARLEGFASRGLDPREARTAFERCLADSDRAADEGRIRAADTLLQQAKGAPAADRRELVAAAVGVLERPDWADEGTPSSVWAAYLASRSGEPATKQEAVQLDRSTRGEWADWFNAHLGPRGGLEPGRTLIIGGAPGAGKTSLGAALAVDALEAGCPVLFWQLELSREEALEHLAAQRPGTRAWWKSSFWTRAWNPEAMPEAWNALLRVPRAPEYEAEGLESAFKRMAREARNARAAGTLQHSCNGLALVDYVQLLTLRDRRARDSGHEVLSTAVSRLAKAAAGSGVCLVLLSQLNKADRREGTLADTALAGADLSRMAHCAVFIQKAQGAPLKPCSSDNPDPTTDTEKGEARLLTWTKTRGVLWSGNTPTAPDRALPIWCHNRALHGGTQEKGSKGVDLRNAE